MTPIGSFQGSKRETWVSSGRSTSIPNWRQTKAASSGEKAMFFGDRGSIAGGMMLTPLLPSTPAGPEFRKCQTVASYSSISGHKREIQSRFRADRAFGQHLNP